jgi:hypothetical protein
MASCCHAARIGKTAIANDPGGAHRTTSADVKSCIRKAMTRLAAARSKVLKAPRASRRSATSSAPNAIASSVRAGARRRSKKPRVASVESMRTRSDANTTAAAIQPWGQLAARTHSGPKPFAHSR